MASLKDLIQVTFEDKTSHVITDSSDVVGSPFYHYWGPVDTLQRLNRSEFLSGYPSALPWGVKPTIDNYRSYAEILSSFDNGSSVVECVRSNPSATYKVFDLVTGDVSNIAATSITVANKLYIAFKYPGVPPSTLLPQGITKLYLGFKTVDGAAITAGNADKKEIIIQVTYDTASASGVVLESYSGFLDKSKRESGVNLYLGELLKKSNLITLVNTISNMDTVVLLGASTSTAIGPNATDPEGKFTEPTLETLDYTKYRDFNKSKTTLLLEHTLVSTSYTGAASGISADRQNCVAVCGYDIEADFTVDDILPARAAVQNMFAAFVAARGSYALFNNIVLISGIGAWAGATSNIAKQVRINQSASAETYGGVSFVVEKDLEFSEVLTLHEEGVISIYNSDNGSQIFGVRSCYPRQSSYYGKINVVRVLSILLRQTFPLVMQVIHTDVASNPITRTSFSITLNNLVSNMVAAQNLKPGSQAVLDGDLNNDVNSRGGTLLNIVFELYFIGLVEKVSIVVSATDSSIKAQIV